jgi:hypothetical protein
VTPPSTGDGVFYLKLIQMINQEAINECFKNIIGFEQAFDDSGIPSLKDELIVSESGKTVQRLHPILSLENIYNCCIYPEGQFSDYLIRKRADAIGNVITRLYSKKNLTNISQELLTDVKMYEGTGNFRNLIVKNERFVGYKITTHYKNVSLSMRTLALQLTEINQATKIYVYHSSRVEPVEIIEVTHSKANSIEWMTFPENKRVILPFIKGGYYLIGYYENDLIGQAIKREQYFQRPPSCNSCNHANFELYNAWSKYISIEPFHVDYDFLEWDENRPKWDEDAEIFVDGSNWGLNLALSIVCDPSDLFCKNRELFIDVLGRQIAIEFLTDIAYSSRDNQKRQKTASAAFFALGNKDNGQPGLLTEQDTAISALNFNTSELDKICLPCKTEGQKIKVRSVY